MREEKPCAGCGTPTTSMCWMDCGMSLCGAPLCDDCRHKGTSIGAARLLASQARPHPRA